MHLAHSLPVLAAGGAAAADVERPDRQVGEQKLASEKSLPTS